MSDLTNQLLRGTVPAGELARALRVSPATLIRRVRAEADRVVRIGRTRSTRYGLRGGVAGVGESEWSMYRIDEGGAARPVGSLVALVADDQVPWRVLTGAGDGDEDVVVVPVADAWWQGQVGMLSGKRAAEEALGAFSPQAIQMREDLRHLPIITIDGEHARDFDDGIAVVKKPGGFYIPRSARLQEKRWRRSPAAGSVRPLPEGRSRTREARRRPCAAESPAI